MVPTALSRRFGMQLAIKIQPRKDFASPEQRDGQGKRCGETA
jgi:hypothetical protein